MKGKESSQRTSLQCTLRKGAFFFFLNTEQNGNNGVEMPSKQLKVLVLATTKYVCLLHNLYISKSLLP